nr:glycine betaine ABC transporter substrate-binding protein [Paracoccus shandongensis]
MVRVDFGVPLDQAEWDRCTAVADCADPKPNGWPADEVLTPVVRDFADKTDPAVIEYLSRRSGSNDAVNALMAWMTDNQATGKGWRRLAAGKSGCPGAANRSPRRRRKRHGRRTGRRADRDRHLREYMYAWPERICVYTALDAERRGATLRPYAAVTGIERAGGRWPDRNRGARRSRRHPRHRRPGRLHPGRGDPPVAAPEPDARRRGALLVRRASDSDAGRAGHGAAGPRGGTAGPSRGSGQGRDPADRACHPSGRPDPPPPARRP